MRRFQSGLTLPEVLVSVAVISVTLGGIATLQFFSLKQSQSLYQRSDFINSLQSIDMDLVKEMDSIPFYPKSQFISGLGFDFEALKLIFDTPDSNQICFNALGFRVAQNDVTCEIKVSYYKVKEEDRVYSSDPNLVGSNFNSAPISRLLYRVTFFDKGVNRTRVYYFSRLKTHVLEM
jgi:prepilin-type N-terminal cleavage/methylation domain-containing protein